MALIITVFSRRAARARPCWRPIWRSTWAPTRRVTLLDIDPQRSLKRWHALRMAHGKGVAIGFSDVSGWRLAGELNGKQSEAEIILVDTPPHIDTDATRTIRAANLVLVPVQPSPPDLWAAEGTLALAATERRRVALLLNRAAVKSRLRTAIENEIAGRRLTLLAPALGNRAAYALAFAQGMGVAETAARTQAGQEFAALAQAVLETAQ